jgi:molecular chaperone DnaK (HSP70)
MIGEGAENEVVAPLSKLPDLFNIDKLVNGLKSEILNVNSSNNGTNIEQHLTINANSPLTPSEISRKTLQASRLLAMEWGC